MFLFRLQANVKMLYLLVRTIGYLFRKHFIEILQNAPYQIPPYFEKLTGDLTGACSRRINIQYRLVYQVIDDEKIVKIISMWTHYE